VKGQEVDQKEPVNVTLCVEDWAVVINALSEAHVPLDTKSRINTIIFECARDTVRTLS
jgi:hypothetical protein